MARFRGTIQGGRGEASRLGHKGLRASINGWDVGVRVYASVGDDGEDVICVIATGGSNGARRAHVIADVSTKTLDYFDRYGEPAITGDCPEGKVPRTLDCRACRDCGRCQFHGAPCVCSEVREV